METEQAENAKLAEEVDSLKAKLHEEQQAHEALLLSESQIDRSISQAEMLLQPHMQNRALPVQNFSMPNNAGYFEGAALSHKYNLLPQG